MTDVSSIMVAEYPTPIAAWSENASSTQAAMEVIKDAIHGARSLRTDYRIANHTKAHFYYQSDSADVQRIVQSQEDDFCTLAKASCLTLLPSNLPTPKGYCIKVLSDQFTLLIDLTGLIDIEQEIARLTKDVDR